MNQLQPIEWFSSRALTVLPTELAIIVGGTTLVPDSLRSARGMALIGSHSLTIGDLPSNEKTGCSSGSWRRDEEGSIGCISMGEGIAPYL